MVVPAPGASESLRARLASAGIALVTNRRAKKIRNGKIDPAALRALVELHGQAFEPASLEELEGAAREIRARDPGLIAICGGDGTYQKTLTALLTVYGDHPLPLLLPLSGGTFNVLTTNLRIGGRADRVLARAVARARGRSHTGSFDVSGLRQGPRSTTVPILRVEDEKTRRAEYGFIFANGVISRIIARYAEGPPSTGRAARVFSEAVGGFMMQTPAAQDLTRRYRVAAAIDGQEIAAESMLAMLAATIQPNVLGFTPFVNKARLRNSFGYLLAAVDASEVIGMLPALLRGRLWSTHEGLRNATAREITLTTEEGFILDGDVYPSGVSRRLRISVGPRLRFLRP